MKANEEEIENVIIIIEAGWRWNINMIIVMRKLSMASATKYRNESTDKLNRRRRNEISMLFNESENHTAEIS